MTDRPAYVFPLRALHWLMAAIIFAAIALGVWAIYLQRGTPLRGEFLDIHKSLGVTALALVVLRLAMRLGWGTPPYLPPIGRFNAWVAGAAHVLIYGAMILLPLSGYVHSMAGKHEFNWFGLYPVPNLIPASEAVDRGAGQAHYVFALAMGALLVLHLLAAVWHRLRGDGVYERVWR
jgi:cytochrome b561